MLAGIVARFAPKAWLMPVTVLDSDGHGTLWAATEGVRYADKHAARVLNLSFGFSQNAGTLTQAIDEASQAGAVVVTSAGNANSSAPQVPGRPPEGADGGGAERRQHQGLLLQLRRGDRRGRAGRRRGQHLLGRDLRVLVGDLLSAPFVAAEAALLLQRSPRLSADNAKQAVLRASRSVNVWNPNYTNQLARGRAGLIDFDAALGGRLEPPAHAAPVPQHPWRTRRPPAVLRTRAGQPGAASDKRVRHPQAGHRQAPPLRRQDLANHPVDPGAGECGIFSPPLLLERQQEGGSQQAEAGDDPRSVGSG